jgi:hypothetical protein
MVAPIYGQSMGDRPLPAEEFMNGFQDCREFLQISAKGRSGRLGRPGRSTGFRFMI